MKSRVLAALLGILSYLQADTFRVEITQLQTAPCVIIQQIYEKEIVHCEQFQLLRDPTSDLLCVPPSKTTNFVNLAKTDKGVVATIGTFGLSFWDDKNRQSVTLHGQCNGDLEINCHNAAVSIDKECPFQVDGNFSLKGQRLSNYGELILLGDVQTDISAFLNYAGLTVSGNWSDPQLKNFLGFEGHRLSVSNVNFPNLPEVRNYGLIYCRGDWNTPNTIFQNLEKVNCCHGEFICEGTASVKLLKFLKFDALTELIRKYSQGQALSIIRFVNPETDVRLQLLQQINRSLLPGFHESKEQIAQLYLNTTEEYARLKETPLQLKFGEPLTQAQLSALQKDIIWPEWHTHKTEGKNIFFVVHLCPNTIKNITISPCNLIAGMVDVTMDINQGLVEANNGAVKIQGKDGVFVNTGAVISRKEYVQITADQAVVNSSGKIYGKTGITSCAPLIISQTMVERELVSDGYVDNEKRIAEMRTDGDLNLQAGNLLGIIGSQLSAQKNVNLESGGDLKICPTEVGYLHKVDSKNYHMDVHGTHGTISHTEGEDINAKAIGSVELTAPEMCATHDMNISSIGPVVANTFLEVDHSHFYHRHKGGWFDGTASVSETNHQENRLRPKLQADSLALATASNIDTEALNVEAAHLNLSTPTSARLRSAKQLEIHEKSNASKGLFTASSHQDGSCDETILEPHIDCEDIHVAGQLSAEIKKGALEPWVVGLCRSNNVDLHELLENHKTWRCHTSTLSGPFRTLLTVCLTIATHGFGANFAATHLGMEAGTAAVTGVGAAIENVTNTAVVSCIANKGRIDRVWKELTQDSFVKNLIAGAISAGLIAQFVDKPILDAAKDVTDEAASAASKCAEISSREAISTAANTANLENKSTFGAVLMRNAKAAAINTGVHTAIEGGKIGSNLARNMAQAVADSGALVAARAIGEHYRNGCGDISYVTHKLAHFVLGATTGFIRGDDPLAAGMGATVGEIVADQMIANAMKRTKAEVLEVREQMQSEGLALEPEDFEALCMLNFERYLKDERESIRRMGRFAAAGSAFVANLDCKAADAAADISIRENSIGSLLESLKEWRIARFAKVVYDGINIFIPIEAAQKVVEGRDVKESLAEIGLYLIPVGAVVKVGSKVVKGGAKAVKGIKGALKEVKYTQAEFKFVEEIGDAAGELTKRKVGARTCVAVKTKAIDIKAEWGGELVQEFTQNEEKISGAVKANVKIKLNAVNSGAKVAEKTIKKVKKATKADFNFSKKVAQIEGDEVRISKGLKPLKHPDYQCLQVKNERLYVRNDLIDPLRKDTAGLTNIERMKKGKAPIGPDGKSMHWHHWKRQGDGALMAVSAKEHQRLTKLLHGLVGKSNTKLLHGFVEKSNIDRRAFAITREGLWKALAEFFDEEGKFVGNLMLTKR